ncbi:MAG: hypothetical protein R8G33_10835 [Gammaproteobacteria bacterium]|nr:hypothetical protein [Gammaproteobacteria bacterium]
MIGDACVFALTQIANEFSCQYGDLVTRRAGPDIACQSDQHQQQCLCVYEKLKQVGLDSFEYEDDLTQVPHGVWVKIQFGGLLGIQRVLQNRNDNKVDNITGVIQALYTEYNEIESFPYKKVVSDMQGYRTRRRRK